MESDKQEFCGSITGLCENIILRQLSQLTITHSEAEYHYKVVDSTYREKKDDTPVKTVETELNFRLESFSVTKKSRIIELEGLLQKVREGQFKPFCLKCGAPITVEMFRAYASDECPTCRGTESEAKNKTLLLRAAKRDDNPLGIYSTKTSKSIRG